MDVRESMKKQNELAMFLGRHVASAPRDPSVADEILCFLNSSPTDELNAVFTEIVSLVYTGGNANGDPEISSVNGGGDVTVVLAMKTTVSFGPDRVDRRLPDKIPKSSCERDTHRIMGNRREELRDVTKRRPVIRPEFDRGSSAHMPLNPVAEEVRVEVNSWVQERTNDLIKDLLPPGSITNQTERVYANALHFKGTWQTSPFDDYDTPAYDGFKVARLPFQGGRGDTNRTFAMYFYLPRKKDGLDTLVERIATTPGFLDAHVHSCEVKVGTFRIPKFEISFGFLVSEVFSQLGLDSNKLYHKACIRIDESGVEAAAATADEACGCYLGMEPPKRIDFVANKPFIFLIREDTTGTVLFVGQIFDPSQSS
ncbi:unnamed protein product [Brassica oleracea]